MDRNYMAVRSVLETPILDEHKWSKLPSLEVDAVLVDLEDSVGPERKAEARERVVEHLRTMDRTTNRLSLCRPNHISTPWGHEDLIALAKADVQWVVYPKIRSVGDLEEVLDIFAQHDSYPVIFPIIETAGAVTHVNALATHPRAAGLCMGPNDLAVDVGISLFDGDGGVNDTIMHAKRQVVLAGSAAHKMTVDTLFAPDLKNLDDVRSRAVQSRRMGFTALATFYPPHLAIIHEAAAPTKDEIADAELVVAAYEDALATGGAAVMVGDGRALTIHDYTLAGSTLAKAGIRHG